MSMQVSQSQGFIGRFGNYVSSYWSQAQEEGPAQIALNSEIRSIVGIYSTYCFPGTAIVGATAANLAPEKVKVLSELLEGGITGMLKRLTPAQKAALAAAGIACVTFFDPTMIFKTLGVIFAFKLGAEYGLRNQVKEIRIAAESNATKKLPQPELMN